MKKVVYKLDIPDVTAKRKAMKAVSTLRGIDFISIDIKAKTLTVIGLVDPVDVVSKLRKAWPTDIISVGPAKEPEKPKEEPKKEEAKKEEPKKEEAKKEEAKEEAKKEEAKGEEGKKEEPKKEEPKKEEEKKKDQPAPIVVQEIPHEEILKAYQRAYYPPPYTTTHYYAQSMEENPNACVIS